MASVPYRSINVPKRLIGGENDNCEGVDAGVDMIWGGGCIDRGADSDVSDEEVEEEREGELKI